MVGDYRNALAEIQEYLSILVRCERAPRYFVVFLLLSIPVSSIPVDSRCKFMKMLSLSCFTTSSILFLSLFTVDQVVAQAQIVATVSTNVPPAPEPYRELMKIGNAEIELYDPSKDPLEFEGETRFKFAISFRYRYRYSTKSENGAKIVTVRPRFTELDIQCTNKIYIPLKYGGDDFWKARLVDHEFEHVRLNCDVRPKLLAEFLVNKLDRFEVRIDDDKEADTKLIDAKISEYVTTIRTEVVRMIQAENDYLDELTKHGLRHLEDLDAFFDERYSPKTLAGYRFKYMKQAEPLFDTKEYARPKVKAEKK